MKKVILTLIFILSISPFLHAQWSNGTNGSIYITTGNVGIGTTTPVAGLSTEAGQNAAIAPLTSVPNGSAWIGGASTNGGITMGQFSGTYGYIQSRNKGTGSTAYNLALNPLGGNIGIGNTNPASQLHISNVAGPVLTLDKTGAQAWRFDVSQGADFRLWNTTVGTAPLTVQSTGYIGIGITNPVSNLHINESTDSKPGGVVAPNKSVFKLSRYGTPNYSYNESAEFRIGHGGPGVWGSQLDLFINGANNINDIPDQQAMTWLYNGNVGIGITNPQNKLDVKGTVHAKSVLIDLNGWNDYVFKKDYRLRSLTEVKAYIDENQHLPEIPSEQEMVKNGLNVAEMNKLLMKKVEELTLYLIEKDKKDEEQQAQIDQLKEQIKVLLQK